MDFSKRIGVLYISTVLLHCRFGPAVLGSLSLPDRSSAMETTGRGLSDLFFQMSSKFYQRQEYRNRRGSGVPGITADSSNAINIDLSNPDYIQDRHHGARRVKKVLPFDMMESMESLPRKSRPHNGITSRSKRFVALTDQLLVLPYLSLAQEAVSEILLGNSAEEVMNSDNQDILEKKNLRTKSNITGLEFKLFQNTLIAALTSFCPKVKAEYSILLDTVQNSVQNEIRAAYPFLPKKPYKNDKLFLLMKRISKCSKTFTHKYQHQKDQDAVKIKAQTVGVKQSRILSIRKYFELEGKRLALLSQMDVIPSVLNIVKLFIIILEKVTQNCLQVHSGSDLVSENQRTGSLLISIIKLTKESQHGKQPTVHQREMEKLIDLSKSCGN